MQTRLNFSFSLGLDEQKTPYFRQVCGIFAHQSPEKNRKSLRIRIGGHLGFKTKSANLKLCFL